MTRSVTQMEKMESKYEKRGVSSSKEEVHQATESLDKGAFPGGFCKAVAYPFDGDKVYLMHADGAGTKSSLAYLYWKETGDKSVFRGIAGDAFVMNLDDLLCVGALDFFVVSSTIGRNKRLIPGEIIKEIIEGTQEYIEMLRQFGAKVENAGGETADVGDIVRTLIVDSTFFTLMDKDRYVDASRIKDGLAIVGLSSFGRAKYEKEYNSGIGSNGLTFLRHELLSKKYEIFEESFDLGIDSNLVYAGEGGLMDPLEGTGLSLGKAMLSTTRTYYPIVRDAIKELGREIFGIIHCSGGGLVKSKKFSKRVKYVKNDLFLLNPLFHLLSKKSEMGEMFQVFNCGHRMEIYVDPRHSKTVIDIAKSYGVDAKVIGFTERSMKEENEVEITFEAKKYFY